MRYDQLIKHEDQQLDETSMSPSTLRAFMNSPEADGIRAGFEAELIFQNMGADSDDFYEPEEEPDYDYDRSAKDIATVVHFFRYNEDSDRGLSREERDNLEKVMIKKYQEWKKSEEYQEWKESPDGDGNPESEWLKTLGIRYMTDAATHFDLEWPYWASSDDFEDDGYDNNYNPNQADILAKSLNAITDMPSRAALGYHSAKRDDVTWIFEPDSSLEADEGDMPVEIISPPMPLIKCYEIIPKFFKWVKENDGYANDTTGFHMGVSLPFVGGNVDFVKLALFLGDEHVLAEFNRSSNQFAKSAVKKLIKNVEPENSIKSLELMRKNLMQLASQALRRADFGKYTSINMKGDYVEFRSAGGSDYPKDAERLQNLLLRYSYAMYLASNPEAESREYAKKLYKLLTNIEEYNSEETNIIKLFSAYNAGTVTLEDLKNTWAQQTLRKDASSIFDTSTWKVYDRRTKKGVADYYGYTKKQALTRAIEELGITDIEDFNKKYVLVDTKEETGLWDIIHVDTGKVVKTVAAPTRAEAYNDIPENEVTSFFARPHIDLDFVTSTSSSSDDNLTPRAKLAKKISSTSAHEQPRWLIIHKPTGERVREHGRPILFSNKDNAEKWLQREFPEGATNDRFEIKQLARATESSVNRVVTPVVATGNRSANPQWNTSKKVPDVDSKFKDVFKQVYANTSPQNKKLEEVAMSPGALADWASSSQAKNVVVGFEFEMYFPDTVSYSDYDEEYLPDEDDEDDEYDDLDRDRNLPSDWLDTISNVVGNKVVDDYTNQSDVWQLVDDASLIDARSSSDAGLELISPPMPMAQSIAVLSKIRTWAKQNGIYTNKSTGLHTNVSISGIKNVDWVKLVLFLGDKHVLDEFDRRSSVYTESSLKLLQNKVKAAQAGDVFEDKAIYEKELDIVSAMDVMRRGNIEIAKMAVQSGLGEDKYQSVHVKYTKDGSYIEFRSPGGDWLNKSPETLINTVYRLGRAMTIAGDPRAERQEYAKKLYKLLSTKNESFNNAIEMFSEYSAGNITATQLKQLWAHKTLQANRKKQNQSSQTSTDLERKKLAQKISRTDDTKTFSGKWLILDARTGRVLDNIGGIGNSETDAKRFAEHWLDIYKYQYPEVTAVEIVPEML